LASVAFKVSALVSLRPLRTTPSLKMFMKHSKDIDFLLPSVILFKALMLQSLESSLLLTGLPSLKLKANIYGALTMTQLLF
jgi:hypothetical protein